MMPRRLDAFIALVYHMLVYEELSLGAKLHGNDI